MDELYKYCYYILLQYHLFRPLPNVENLKGISFSQGRLQVSTRLLYFRQ